MEGIHAGLTNAKIQFWKKAFLPVSVSKVSNSSRSRISLPSDMSTSPDFASARSLSPKKLPIGIQSCPKLIESSHIYGDKTEAIYCLITGSTTRFLSRPRWFGKSLLLFTSKAIFEERCELFHRCTGAEYPCWHGPNRGRRRHPGQRARR
uniref:Predicted AAA-ATPase n=1 Tax=Candidatus Kentrum sp. LFY TaxID=2126342 RepID=A0A450U5Z8_9GAMM|nr:MAG: Predicted AAA-ATPase [Candidatus Kentron sp. LFY]